ncbi:MAG: hypothetical protein ACE5JL_00215, partial [Dehalococcoidia bacterium]
DLETQVSNLDSRVKALHEERNDIHESIIELRETGVQEIRQTVQEIVGMFTQAGDEAQEYASDLACAAIRYGNLRAEAATLEAEVRAARAIRRGEAEYWHGLPAEMSIAF